MTWRVEILNATVAAEIDAFPLPLRTGLTRIIDRIEAIGLERVGEPLVKHLEGKLWEMRPSGADLAGRALYVTAVGRRVVIVAAFIKKTRKTPRRFIDLALQRAKELR